MLSHRALDRRIESQAVQIWYSFLPEAVSGKPVLQKPAQLVDLAKPDSPATVFFQQNRYSTHMHLTAGCIVQAHSNHKIAGRKPYPHYPTCFDLRESNEIVFEPFEMLTILTNEEIALDGKTAVIVTPRVTNTDAGLIVTTAYIDAYYQGILRVVVHNITPARQTLKVMDPVAQCFFFNLTPAVAPIYQTNFADKTKFYRHNWERLLSGDRDPFPRQKKPIPDENRVAAVKRRIAPYMSREWLGLFGGIGSIAGVVLYFILNFRSTVEGHKALKADFDTLHTTVSALDKASPHFGNHTVVIPANASEGRAEVTSTRPIPSTSHVWLSIDRASATVPDDVDVSYQLTPGISPIDTRLRLIARARNGPVKSDVRVPVLWAITQEAP